MITNYKNLPIGKYLQILNITESEPLEEMRNPAILSILDGRSVLELENLPIMEFSHLMHGGAFLLTPPATVKTRKSYECGPFELVPVLDYKKITTAQYVDFQEMVKAAGDAPAIVEVLSCLMVPAGHKYCDGYDPGEVRAAIREHMNTTDAVSLYSFFFERLLRLMRRLATSSKKALLRLPKRKETGPMVKEALKKLDRMNSELDGVGLPMLMRFQKLSETLGTPCGE